MSSIFTRILDAIKGLGKSKPEKAQEVKQPKVEDHPTQQPLKPLYPPTNLKVLEIDRDTFYNSIRPLGSLHQNEVDGLNKILGYIEQDISWQDVDHLAYFLATIKHETGITLKGIPQTYNPILELRSDSNAEAKYGHRSRKGRELGNNKPGDGAAFKGMGYIQVTGKGNAKRLEPILGVNLTQPPSEFRKRLGEPLISYKAASVGMQLGLYTGKDLQDYDRANSGFNAAQARRIINGTDKRHLIAGYYRIFRKALIKSITKHSNTFSMK